MQDYVVEEPRPSPPVSDIRSGTILNENPTAIQKLLSVYTLYAILDSLRLSLQALRNIWELLERKS